MHLRGIPWAFKLLLSGRIGILFVDAWTRAYRSCYSFVFWAYLRRHRPSPHPFDGKLQLQTDHPVAFKSPDHLVPWGTKYDNSSNKKFIFHMLHLICPDDAQCHKAMLDLGCSGGQLVRDFKDLGWLAAGLEGSDYSLKHRRANWPALANRNLFTCDITKPFQLSVDGQAVGFDLVTAWEVLEHIHPDDLPRLFANINAHFNHGGYFVASTTPDPDVHDGIDLHQSKFSNQEWRAVLARLCPDWEPVDLGLKYYQYVRFNYGDRSFLSYRKK